MSLLEHWKESHTRRQEFVAILQEPVLVEAIAIIKEQAYAPRQMPSGVSLTEWGAVMGWKREGYLECLTNLLSLANITPHEMPDRKPWDPPDNQARLAQAEAEIAREMTGKEGPTAGAVAAINPGPIPNAPVLQTEPSTPKP